MEWTLDSPSEERTVEIAARIGAALGPGWRVALSGPLGVGKTRFAQGLIRGLGCDDIARSPSYVLMIEHEGRCPIYHCDWYRLESDGDVESTGIEDCLRPDAIVIVEWADKHPGWLAPPLLDVRLHDGGGDRRRLTLRIEGGDAVLPPLLDALAGAAGRRGEGAP